jgi:AcrR family transcriptional regulator
MFHLIEAQFAARGRTPKGRRAMGAIFRATREILASAGLEAASLDLIADRAGLTQAALRHYFPTRDELFTAFFVTATEWLRLGVADILRQEELLARDKLERCIGWHLEYMESVDTVFWLEASAYRLRVPPGRRARDEWYRWLTGQYATLIAQIQPAVSVRERERKSYAILTLILGGWITHGRGSTLARSTEIIDQRQLLIDTAMEIAMQ